VPTSVPAWLCACVLLAQVAACGRDPPARDHAPPTAPPAAGCAEVAARIGDTLRPQLAPDDRRMAEMFEGAIGVMRASCEEDGWPEAVKRCLLDATPPSPDALAACNQQMPAELQQQIQARMTHEMKRLELAAP
jgi:hypothetical protein